MRKNKKIAIVLLALIMALMSGNVAEAKGKFWTLNFGKVVISNGFTFRQLENRNGKLYIEITNGKVINNKGDGKEENNRGKQNYVFYGKQYKKGTKMVTVSIYNPDNNIIDDIIFCQKMKR